ncbi:MAG: hypothetical protein ACI90V_010827 [Bacillariaceae sp.]|jgi:hypothetical protein
MNTKISVFFALLLSVATIKVVNAKATYDENLPLYENVLTLNATTPLTSRYEDCIGWRNGTNPDGFTWFGMRIQLPVDADTSNGQYYSAIIMPDPADGYTQPYNTTDPETLLNYTFQTHEKNPTIRINMNNDIFWDSYQFTSPSNDSFDLQQEEKTYGVLCTLSESEDGESATDGAKATLTVSLSQNLIRNGTSSPISSESSLGCSTVSSTVAIYAVAIVGAFIFAL